MTNAGMGALEYVATLTQERCDSSPIPLAHFHLAEHDRLTIHVCDLLVRRRDRWGHCRRWRARRAAVGRERGRTGKRGGHGDSVDVEVAPVPSVLIVGLVRGVPGSASSAGRTWVVVSAGRLGCSLDRLTPTLSRLGPMMRASSATMGFGKRPCCNEEAPDGHGRWVGSAPRS